MSKQVKDPSNDATTTAALTAILILAIVIGGGLAVAMHLGTAISAVEQHVPLNPADVIGGLATGTLVWPAGATVVAVGLAVCVSGLAGVIGIPMARRRAQRSRVDDDARHLGTLRDVRSLSEKACRATAARLGTTVARRMPPGVPLGMFVGTKVPLYGDIESTHADIWGPRTGKSSSRVIPAILAAMGSVMTTSNKRDVVDHTRAYRAEQGQVWIFDPQRVANEPPTWFWDPLSWVRSTTPLSDSDTIGTDPTPASPSLWERITQVVSRIGRGSQSSTTGESEPITASTLAAAPSRTALADVSVQERKAAALARQFAVGDDGENARRDAFFDPEGEDLLAALILAAAIDGRPITQVYRWVTDDSNLEPVRILRAADYSLAADGLSAHYNATEKQRSGVFTTAKKTINCLKFRSVHAWVERNGPDDDRPEFHPERFARSDTDTLYTLSKEGIGSVGPLVTALTVAVCDEILDRASEIPGGRLATPVLFALDEVANVVRWQELPRLYSHFGSRGIIIMSILQSWSQGVRCWGEDGMKALWSAANIKVYGGGVAVDDGSFLRNMSTALGDHYELTGSVSTGRNGHSQSRQRTEIRTFKEDKLEALPRGRAIVRSSGNPPVMIRTVQWTDGPFAAAVTRAKADAQAQPVAPQSDSVREVPEL